MVDIPVLVEHLEALGDGLMDDGDGHGRKA